MFELEVALQIPDAEKPLYVLYPDEFGGNWRIQAVPVAAESFESRKALPAKWRGVRDDELSKLSGVEGCIFVHASGFTGGACCRLTTLGARLEAHMHTQVTRQRKAFSVWRILRSRCEIPRIIGRQRGLEIQGRFGMQSTYRGHPKVSRIISIVKLPKA